jgi:hypothetical protein
MAALSVAACSWLRPAVSISSTEASSIALKFGKRFRMLAASLSRSVIAMSWDALSPRKSG